MTADEESEALQILEKLDAHIKAVTEDCRKLVQECNKLRAELAESERQHDVIINALRAAWNRLGAADQRAEAA